MLKRGFWDNPRGKPPQTRRRNTNYKTKKNTDPRDWEKFENLLRQKLQKSTDPRDWV